MCLDPKEHWRYRCKGRILQYTLKCSGVKQWHAVYTTSEGHVADRLINALNSGHITDPPRNDRHYRVIRLQVGSDMAETFNRKLKRET